MKTPPAWHWPKYWEPPYQIRISRWARIKFRIWRSVTLAMVPWEARVLLYVFALWSLVALLHRHGP